jgi:hypothetical protein
MIRMRTGKLMGGKMDTTMRGHGLFFAGRSSWTTSGSDETLVVDSARLRTACGQFVSAAAVWSQTVKAVAWARMRTVCCRVCARGLKAFVDCSRTRINRVCGLFCACSRSLNCRVCGRERFISRGCSAYAPRMLRGPGNLRHEGVTRALS